MTTGPVSTLIEALDLAPLPLEGGYFRSTHADESYSRILFLLGADDISALHRLTAPEEYQFLGGAPLRLLILDDEPHTVVLDRQHRTHTVPAGTWQGSSSAGEWTLVSTLMRPPFNWDMFTLGDRASLTHSYPSAADAIAALTRVEALR